MNRFMLFVSLLVLFAAEILRVYLIMPFPGSQVTNTVSFAYWLNYNINWIRLLALAIAAIPAVKTFKGSGNGEKILAAVVLTANVVVFFLFNFRYQADKIFYLPTTKSFVSGVELSDRSKLVIGIVINGEAKAYPIQLIGYHHQVMDTIGNTPVMVTYCTVCRTGRAFSPVVNGRPESFRLVGMDHFNAVFEDAGTKSWWQQATGVAITGPLKGTALKEFPSAQLPLDAWLRQNPGSLVMQPDTLFNERYFRLEDYDSGNMQSELVKRDTLSWQPKSWIVGVRNSESSKAYDWNDLVKRKIIHDSIARLPILLAMERDTNSFHVYDRRINGFVLNFQMEDGDDVLIDQNTNSRWNMDGLCIAGSLKGEKLARVQAYNEFWHSWKTFNMNAGVYRQ